MVAHVAWFVVVWLIGLAACGTAVLVAALHPGAGAGRRSPIRPLATGAAAVGALVVLGLLWAWEPIARADGQLVALLEDDRKTVMAGNFAILTTVGDAIPMLTIATAIAAVLFVRGGGWVALLLPFVVIVEQVLQVGAFNLLPTLALDDVVSGVVTGSAGTFPSGSVARMTAVFGVASLIVGHVRLSGATAFRATLVALVVVQAVSRLYLGRHLVVDVAGGLALGLVVVAGAALVLTFLPRPAARTGGTTPTEPAYRS